MAVACFTAQAQISTNNVSVNIGALVQNAQSVSSVTIQGQYWTVNGQTFFPNPPVTLGRYNYPAITNGVVIFSNTVCGIPYKLTLSGYSDYVTNFCIPATAVPDGSGNVSAAQYVGQYVSPTKFFWASPVVTNYNIGSGSGTATNISNSTGTNVNLSGSFAGNHLDINNTPLIATNFDPAGAAAQATQNMLTNGAETITDATGDSMCSGTVSDNAGDRMSGGLVKDSQGDTMQNGIITALTGFVGPGSGLTGIPWSAITNPPTIPTTNGFITASTASNITVASAVTVTGPQSNTIATALQSVPGNYLTTNGNGSALTGLPTTNSVVQTNDTRSLNLTNANNVFAANTLTSSNHILLSSPATESAPLGAQLLSNTGWTSNNWVGIMVVIDKKGLRTHGKEG